jgi:hypothetical protein
LLEDWVVVNSQDLLLTNKLPFRQHERLQTLTALVCSKPEWALAWLDLLACISPKWFVVNKYLLKDMVAHKLLQWSAFLVSRCLLKDMVGQ